MYIYSYTLKLYFSESISFITKLRTWKQKSVPTYLITDILKFLFKSLSAVTIWLYLLRSLIVVLAMTRYASESYWLLIMKPVCGKLTVRPRPRSIPAGPTSNMSSFSRLPKHMTYITLLVSNQQKRFLTNKKCIAKTVNCRCISPIVAFAQ